MKIARMIIKELHGCYDYDISFNPDITFLYGENGCGKTTVLRLLSSIISGELFVLDEYEFNYIQVHYSNDNISSQIITVIKMDEKLSITFNGNTTPIVSIDSNARNRHGLEDQEFFENAFFDANPICVEIKNSFDNLYIPLDRINIINNATERKELRRIFRYRRLSKGEYSPVEAMVATAYTAANVNLRNIDDNFRNQILKSSLEHNAKHIDISETIKDFFTEDQTSFFENVKTSYINLMKELDLLSDNEEKRTREYFDELEKQYEKVKQSTNYSNVEFELLLKYQELKNFLSIKELSDKMSEEKNKVTEPFTRFLSIINEFIKEGNNDKKIAIDEMGYIYLESEYGNRKIDIQNMSSGEKQLIVFFAYLIFGVSDKDAVFIVDEPELSLHLTWQRKFVNCAASANEKVQLIFATHSPEIIGSYEDKMVKVAKYYVGE